MKTSAFIKRHSNNPVLSAKNVPYNDALVFNAGVAKFKGRYVMIFRNDLGSMKRINILLSVASLTPATS